jgi:MYXO-CTERM domain-containing protein
MFAPNLAILLALTAPNGSGLPEERSQRDLLKIVSGLSLPPVQAAKREAAAVFNGSTTPTDVQVIPSTLCTSDDQTNGALPLGCTTFQDTSCQIGVPVYELAPSGTAGNALQSFYALQPNIFDTVVFFRDYLQDFCIGSAYYLPIANEITGIGKGHVSPTGNESYNFRPNFGLPATAPVTGLIDMGQYYDCQIAAELGSSCSTAADTESVLGILGQESGHQWGAFVHFKDARGVDHQDLLGRQNEHWSWFFNTGGGDANGGSPIEGNFWVPSDGGVFDIGGYSGSAYSPLDQYLMGVRAAADVPPLFYVANPQAPPGFPFEMLTPGEGVAADPPYGPNVTPFEPSQISGTETSTSVWQIQSAEGARSPAFGQAAFFTRQAWVLLTAPGDDAGAQQAAIDAVDQLRHQWTAFFYSATDHRMRALTTLSGRDDLPLWLFHVSTEGWSLAHNGTFSIGSGDGGVVVEPADDQVSMTNLNVKLQAGQASAALIGATFPAGDAGSLQMFFSSASTFAPGDVFSAVNPVDGRHYEHRILYLGDGGTAQAVADWTGEIHGLSLALATGASSTALSQPILVDRFELTANPPSDRDHDGIADDEDNCPDVPNADQANSSDGGLGDACRPKPVVDAGVVDAGAPADGGNPDDAGLLADGGAGDGGILEAPPTGCGCGVTGGNDPLWLLAFIGLAALMRPRRHSEISRLS